MAWQLYARCGTDADAQTVRDRLERLKPESRVYIKHEIEYEVWHLAIKHKNYDKLKRRCNEK